MRAITIAAAAALVPWGVAAEEHSRRPSRGGGRRASRGSADEAGGVAPGIEGFEAMGAGGDG